MNHSVGQRQLWFTAKKKSLNLTIIVKFRSPKILRKVGNKCDATLLHLSLNKR